MAKKAKKPRVVDARLADKNNAVLTVSGGSGGHCRTPCEQCPWRVDQTGKFPAKAFLLSARTSYDMAQHTFACHMRGSKAPATCAGFILQAGSDNLTVRMKRMGGDMLSVTDGGLKLHASYRAMALANGCDPKDPELAPCMPEARFYTRGKRTL